ncbi:hypothetical protein D3C79_1010680 [compost metagenome]
MPVTATRATLFAASVALPLGMRGLPLALPMPLIVAITVAFAVTRVGERSARRREQCH